jgi:RHS repeat-associated protein
VPSDNVGGVSAAPAGGSFAVSQDGAATYTYPIWVPRGRKGIEPLLAITYNSRRENGVLGVGWSVQGLSSINRCKHDLARDGENSAIAFQANDSFCLDGQRLVPFDSKTNQPSGATQYGPQGMEFRTEEGSFIRITGSPPDGLGPVSFEVDYKDGRRFLYGTTQDSRLESIAYPSGKVRLAWALSEVRDLFGNNLTIQYCADGAQYCKDGHEQLPETIQYTGTVDHSLLPQRTVTFHYETRPDISQSFVSGYELRSTQRLTAITLSAPNPIDTESVKSYIFTYQQSKANGRSLLSGVTECDGSSDPTTRVCLAPTTFNYSSQSPDGFTDINTGIHDWTGGQSNYVGSMYSRLGQIIVGDVNGDGCDDFTYTVFSEWGLFLEADYRLSSCYDAIASSTSNAFSTPQVSLSSLPSGIFYQVSPQSSRCGSLDGTCFYNELVALDLDLDGRVDLLNYSVVNRYDRPTWEQDFQTNVFLASTVPPSQWNSSDGLYAGESSSPIIISTPSADGHTYPPSYAYTKIYVGDINGDGLPDLIRLTPTGWSYALNHGRGTFCDTAAPCLSLSPESPINLTGPLPNFWTPVSVLDIDQDGTADVILTTTDSNTYQACSLDAANTVRTLPMTLRVGSSYNPSRRDWFLDVNGDGLPDTLSVDPEHRWLSINTGNGVFTGPIELPLVPLPSDGLLFFDYDGDGTTDIIYPSADGFLHASLTGQYNPDQPWLGFGDVQVMDQNQKPIPAPVCKNAPCRCTPCMWAFDVNGDGLTDLITVLDGTIHVYVRQGQKRDLLVNILDRGASTSITYAPITSAATYKTTVPPGIVSSHGATYFSPSSTYVMNRGPWVVASYTVPKPGLGSGTYTVAYADGRSSLIGRGWLGFAAVTTTDAQTGAIAATSYDNSTMVGSAYPFAMKPKVQDGLVTLPNGLFNRRTSSTTYEVSGSTDGKYVVVLPQEVVQNEFEGPPGNFSLIRHFDTTFQYDNFGNPNMISRTTGDGYTDSTATKYYYNVPQWLVAMPAQITDTSSTSAGQSLARTTQYTPDLQTGAVGTQIIEPQGDATLCNLTAYDLDAHGVLKQTRSYACSEGQAQGSPRTLSFDHDPVEDSFPTAVTNALSQTETFLFHPALGVLIAAQDPNNVQWRWQYDHFARVKEVLAPDQANISLSYGPFCGYLCVPGMSQTTKQYVGGQQVITVYDAYSFEVLHGTTGFDGQTIRTDMAYNGQGLLARRDGPCFVSDSGCPATHRQQYTYDNLGRITSVLDANGYGSRWDYNGLTTTATDAVGHQQYTIQDQLGRVVKSAAIVAPRREIATNFVYEPFGLLHTVTDAQGNETRILHDIRGHPQVLNDPDSLYHLFLWNSFDELYKENYGNDHVRTYDRDALGRILTLSDQDGKTTYEWDTAPNGIGKLSKATSTDQITTSYTYNPIGKVSGTTWTIGGDSYTFSFAYDPKGRLSTLTYPTDPTVSGVPSYVLRRDYNQFGFLQQVVDPASAKVLWKIDAKNEFNEITKEEFGDGTITQRDYDSAGRTTHILTTGAAGSSQDLGLAYFPNGSLMCRTDRMGSTNMVEHILYDPLDRIRDWNAVAVPSSSLAPCSMPRKRRTYLFEESFVYDDIGNLKQRSTTQGSGPNLTYQYGANGQYLFGPHAVTQVNSDSYLYLDGEGNQTAGPNRTVTYKAFNLPAGITDGANQSTTFSYDASQERALKASANTTTVYVGNLFERRVQNGQSSLVFYVPGGERLVAQIQPSAANADNQVLYLHDDGLGSIQAVTSASGAVLERLWYEPFGQSTDPSNPQVAMTPPLNDVTLGFSAQNQDNDLNLVSMKGRIYDPKIGRFLTPDAVIQDPLRSESLNRYTYAWNNPLKWTDPSGLQDALIVGTYEDFGEFGFSFGISYSSFSFGGGSANPGSLYWGRSQQSSGNTTTGPPVPTSSDNGDQTQPPAPSATDFASWQARSQQEALSALSPSMRDAQRFWAFDEQVGNKVFDPFVKTVSTGLRYFSRLGGVPLMLFTNYGLDQADENMRAATGGAYDTSGGELGHIARTALALTDLYKLDPLPQSAAAKNLALSGSWGGAFESSVLSALGLEKYTGPAIAGGAIPDALTVSEMWEIKDVAYLSYEAQLRLEVSEALRRGIPLNVVVNPYTRVSGPLLGNVAETGGWVFRFDPQTGIFTPYTLPP